MTNFAAGILGTLAALAAVIVLALLIARSLSRPVRRGKRSRP